MNITIKGTHLELTDAIKNYAEEKIGALEKFDERIQLAKVELERITGHKSGDVFRAEVQVDAPNVVYRAEVKQADLYAAIDLLVPKISVQIEKHKDHVLSKTRKVQRRLKTGES